MFYFNRDKLYDYMFFLKGYISFDLYYLVDLCSVIDMHLTFTYFKVRSYLAQDFTCTFLALIYNFKNPFLST